MNKLLLISISSLAIISSGFSEDAKPTPPPANITQATEVCNQAKWVSDKLTSAMADVVTKATSVAGDAKDFVVQQLPDVIQQLLRWKMLESLAPMVFWFSMFWTMFLLVNRGIKNRDFYFLNKVEKREKGYNPYDDVPYNGPFVFGFGLAKAFVGLFSAIAFMFTMNLTWLQIWLAPKVYLIEYVRGMVSK